MVKAKFLHGSEDISKCIEIRRRVFVEEMGIAEVLEFDGDDERAFHVVAETSDGLVGTLRLLFEMNGSVKIGHFAVLNKVRGEGIGDMLIRMALNKISNVECEKVIVNAVADKRGFYEKYGFKSVPEPNFDYGHERYIMELKREDINLAGSCRK